MALSLAATSSHGRPSPSPSPPPPTSAPSSLSSFTTSSSISSAASSSRKMTAKLVHAPSHRDLGRGTARPTAAVLSIATETPSANGRRQLAKTYTARTATTATSTTAPGDYSAAPDVHHGASTSSSSSSYGSSSSSVAGDIASSTASAAVDVTPSASRSSPDQTPTRPRTALAITVREPTVLSLTDEALSEVLTFHREIGFGNWGSVWLCTRKTDNPPRKVAVKLVHRSTRSSTTTARIQALWNEVKVLHSLPLPSSNDGTGRQPDEGGPARSAHPSIIAFEAFVLSPSYALVSMAYCDRPMPVGISEDRARPYFRSLIDGVRFLHANNVSHNDIKPANVLLSDKDEPVLVDFGFATYWGPTIASSYDAGQGRLPRPFISSTSWGTPEYLSATRAAGEEHDERTSDVWSLGVTCFEILTGRTPFERSELEAFTTPAELEIYHARTAAGTWLGEWSLSRPMEDLLRGMTDPVDERRLTAEQAVEHRALCKSTDEAGRYAFRHAQPPTTRLPTPVERTTVDALAAAATTKSALRADADTDVKQNDDQWSYREKKTASPPKKVVRVTAAAAAAAAGARPAKPEVDGVAAFLRFDKTVDRQVGNEEPSVASVGPRLGQSPSKERLRAAKAVKVKVHTSPRKVSASSPRRSRIATATTSSANAGTRTAYHRPTPINNTGSAIPVPQPKTVLNRTSAVIDGGRSSEAELRTRKRPERILIDTLAGGTQLSVATSSGADGRSKPKQVEHRYTDADEADKENVVVRAPPSAVLARPLQPAQSTRSRIVRRVPVPSVKERPLSQVSQIFGETPTLRPSASARTLNKRVSEASLPSIEIAQSSGDAGIDTKLDRISLWARSVDRMVEETRDSIHARNSLIGATSTTSRGHKPSQSESFLTTPSKNELAAGLRPSHVLSPSHKVTPSRTTLNGQPVYLPNGRGLADVPESISGSPAIAGGRSLSTPARDDGWDGHDAAPPIPHRVYETIHFAPLQDGSMRLGETVTEQEAPRSTRLKRSRSKLLALFQAAHDPRSDPALTAIPTERLSFLKFPPPESDVAPLQTAHAPIKHRSSLLRLKSIKNIRSALTKDREAARNTSPPTGLSVVAAPSQIPVPVGSKPTAHARQPSTFGRPSATLSRRGPSPQPPTPSTLNTSELLTPRSILPPEPVEIVPLDRAESRTATGAYGTLSSARGVGNSLARSRSGGGNGTQASRKSHRSTPSLSEGLRSLFSPTPPPFSKAELDRERERTRSGTPNTMLSAWTDTTAGDLSIPANKGGRFATALKGLSFGRRHKKTPSSAVVNPALEYDY